MPNGDKSYEENTQKWRGDWHIKLGKGEGVTLPRKSLLTRGLKKVREHVLWISWGKSLPGRGNSQ